MSSGASSNSASNSSSCTTRSIDHSGTRRSSVLPPISIAVHSSASSRTVSSSWSVCVASFSSIAVTATSRRASGPFHVDRCDKTAKGRSAGSGARWPSTAFSAAADASPMSRAASNSAGGARRLAMSLAAVESRSRKAARSCGVSVSFALRSSRARARRAAALSGAAATGPSGMAPSTPSIAAAPLTTHGTRSTIVGTRNRGIGNRLSSSLLRYSSLATCTACTSAWARAFTSSASSVPRKSPSSGMRQRLVDDRAQGLDRLTADAFLENPQNSFQPGGHLLLHRAHVHRHRVRPLDVHALARAALERCVYLESRRSPQPPRLRLELGIHLDGGVGLAILDGVDLGVEVNRGLLDPDEWDGHHREQRHLDLHRRELRRHLDGVRGRDRCRLPPAGRRWRRNGDGRW